MTALPVSGIASAIELPQREGERKCGLTVEERKVIEAIYCVDGG